MTTNDGMVLFKSTARGEYRKLVLTALSAPVGTFFWTYYKEKYVSEDLIKKIRESSSSFPGKKVALIFFNLNPNEKLKFYPLREFTIWDTKINGGTLEFLLCPGEYYVYTRDELEGFNKSISNEMLIIPPSERSWVQLSFPSCLDKLRKSKGQAEGHGAWEKLVEYLDRAEIGNNYDFKESIFFRINTLKEAEMDVKYTPETGFILKAGKLYRLEGYFYKPRETKESFHVKLEGNEEIAPITDQINILPGKNEPFTFEFRCKAVYDDKNLKIRIYSPERTSTGNAPYHEFPVKIAKLPLFKSIGMEGGFVFFGLLINSIAQTYVAASELKIIISAIGNLLTTFGIIRWQRRSNDMRS